jgi:Protein of unknown function (DUF3558)
MSMTRRPSPRDETARTRRALLPALGSAVAAGALIAGCVPGIGVGEETSRSPEAPVMRVNDPRDVAAVADRPCDLLTPQQAAVFGLDRPPRELPGAAGGVDCEWRSSRADVWVYLSTSIDEATLETVYANRERLPYLERTVIAGYPAIASRTDATLPVCDLDIKTAERQSVTVTYDSTRLSGKPQQSCVVGKQVAQTVVLNLPPKQ